MMPSFEKARRAYVIAKRGKELFLRKKRDKWIAKKAIYVYKPSFGMLSEETWNVQAKWLANDVIREMTNIDPKLDLEIVLVTIGSYIEVK